MRPRVDVVITHFNQHEYVGAAVASALDQDDVDTRVILVDDASPVPLSAAEWPQDRVVMIRRESRGGPGAALNTGLRATRAQFVAILDGDDLFPTFRSALLVQVLQERSADIVYGGQVTFAHPDVPQLRLTPAQVDQLPAGQVGPLPGTSLLNRHALELLGPMPQDRFLGTFVEWLAVARTGTPPPVEVAVEKPVLLRRSHGRNITRTITDRTGYLTAVAAAWAGRR
jgi:glycosyltransferase involved in cell wall biosynthesis